MALYSLGIRDVVRVSGPDAHKLLNDTLTCRFDEALNGVGRWFALLSPQGKIQIDGLVTYARDAWWFDMDAGLVNDFLKKMKLYRLRAKAEFETLNAEAIWWSPDGEAPGPQHDVIAFRDERSHALGTRYINVGGMLLGNAVKDGDPIEAYERVRIETGVPEFVDYGRDHVFPHDVAMDLLGGLDFKKGCYIGQEVVSRMEHRGTARRRPVHVAGVPGSPDMVITDGVANPARELDTPLQVNGRDAGTVGYSVDGNGIAIVRLDRIPDDGAATVNGVPVKLAIPSWGTYRFGESGTAE